MQEAERVMETFTKHLHLPVTKIDDSKRMLATLKVRTPSYAVVQPQNYLLWYESDMKPFAGCRSTSDTCQTLIRAVSCIDKILTCL